MTPVAKGLLIGTAIYAVIAASALVPAAMAAVKVGGAGGRDMAATFAYLVPPLALSLAVGGALGFLAGTLRERRRLRLLLVAALGYYLSALLISATLILSEPNYPGGFSAQLGGILLLSITGSLLYGIVMIPMLVGGVLILEGWTRSDAETNAS